MHTAVFDRSLISHLPVCSVKPSWLHMLGQLWHDIVSKFKQKVFEINGLHLQISIRLAVWWSRTASARSIAFRYDQWSHFQQILTFIKDVLHDVEKRARIKPTIWWQAKRKPLVWIYLSSNLYAKNELRQQLLQKNVILFKIYFTF